MAPRAPKSRNREEVILAKPPLNEAWLEIRWKLHDTPEGLQIDPGFPFALGTFYHGVKDRYAYRVDLDASRAPQEMLPFVVRHQFRPGKEEWPVLQIGPGVATVNLTRPYSWDLFLNEIRFLRDQLVEAYGDDPIKTDLITLRYKNSEPFDYRTNDFLEFLRTRLNTELSLPGNVPGNFASRPSPTSGRIRLSFDLARPKGTGALLLGTGTQTMEQDTLPHARVKAEVLLWQLELASGGDDAPNVYDESQFHSWLGDAHSVLHEWFFSLIEGALLQEYMDEGG